MAVLMDLVLFLQAQGLGTPITTIFQYGFPLDVPAVATQDAVLALIPVPGLPSAKTHDGLAWENPVIQVLVRGTPYGYAAAEVRAYAAFVALEGVHNQTLGTTVYLWIMALQPPFFLKLDELARPILAFNVRCAKYLP